MNYQTYEGGYAAAIEFALTSGGHLFLGNGPDTSHTVTHGHSCYTFWEENSVKRKDIESFAKMLGMPHPSPTTGRIARFVIKEVICIPQIKGGAHPLFRQLAKSGHHWHFTSCNPGYYPHLFEFDVKSAYAAAICEGKSFLWAQSNKKYMDDGGALDIFREIYPQWPRWLRMSLIGILASHTLEYLTLTKSDDGKIAATRRYIPKIAYPFAFEAVHKGILSLYRSMAHIHSMGGEWIPRMHTDSFALTHTVPIAVENSIFHYIEECGYKVALKASGSSHFWDLNTGIIGKKLIGSKVDVLGGIEKNGGKIQWMDLTAAEETRWNNRTLTL